MNAPRRPTRRTIPNPAPRRTRGPRERRSAALRRAAGSLTLLTLLGHTLLGFEQACLAPVVGALTGVAAEFGLETVDAWARRRPARYLGTRDEAVDFFLPSYTCGLLCAMLLHGDSGLAPVALAVLIGVGGTYALRVRVPGAAAGPGGDVPGTPFMNPSNTGVTAVLLLFPWVGAAPQHQFTAGVSGPLDAIVPLVVLAAGLASTAGPAGRLPLVLGWTAGFALQALARGGLGDVSVAAALLPMTGTAFAVHTAYMLADPATAPRRPRDQVAFGLATAALYGLLVQFHVVSGLFLSLALACAGRGLVLACAARGPASAVPVRLGPPGGAADAPPYGRQPMPGAIRSSTRSDPSRRTSSNAPEASARR
ncbi:hypothetical protein GCM10010517_46070 [Streptosporangium fragile]|uniref:Uncharacterized protein n=1 Tax=Streptosporangium fragile TaxID=46186 RepID=A0ABN3W2T7_9ACTN